MDQRQSAKTTGRIIEKIDNVKFSLRMKEEELATLHKELEKTGIEKHNLKAELKKLYNKMNQQKNDRERIIKKISERLDEIENRRD